jgi:hypothetical protein
VRQPSGRWQLKSGTIAALAGKPEEVRRVAVKVDDRCSILDKTAQPLRTMRRTGKIVVFNTRRGLCDINLLGSHTAARASRRRAKQARGFGSKIEYLADVTGDRSNPDNYALWWSKVKAVRRFGTSPSGLIPAIRAVSSA